MHDLKVFLKNLAWCLGIFFMICAAFVAATMFFRSHHIALGILTLLSPLTVVLACVQTNKELGNKWWQ